MIQTFKETELTRCFVAPELCSHLLILGLYAKTAYTWRVYQKEVKLHTYVFDEDDYYKDGFEHESFIQPPELEFPAFSLKDLEIHLPLGWFSSLNDFGIYEIALSNKYEVEMCSASRLPDAYARMLLLCLRKKVLDIKEINKSCSKKEHNSNA